MGLLDSFNTDEARLGLGLLAAGGYSPTPMSFGQRVQMAMQGQDAYKRQQAKSQLEQLQMQEAQESAGQRKQATVQAGFNQDAVRRSIGGGTFDPRTFLQNNPQADLSGLTEAMKFNSAINPAPKYETLAPGSSLYKVGQNGPELTITAPKEKNPNQPFSLGPNGELVPNIAYQDYEKSKARAGASNVSVNTGQKGLDNTLKLRGDFRSEPIYKAHQEVQSAYSQIVQALDQASPAGDLAGATKFMKILDPGSVVRESELGMAMSASGAMDRLQYYTTNIMNGTKLTPTQRADFKKLATSLYDESAKQYNIKRGEYQGIAERNGLNVPDVLGAGATERKPAAMDSLPTANSSNRGRRIRNTETGKEFVSNGMQWKEVK